MSVDFEGGLGEKKKFIYRNKIKIEKFFRNK